MGISLAAAKNSSVARLLKLGILFNSSRLKAEKIELLHQKIHKVRIV